MGKFDCPKCGKTASKCASNKTGSVLCSVCTLWYHPPCAKVEPGTLDIIHKVVELGMASPWVCEVCVSGLEKMSKDVKQNKAKIGVLEGKVEAIDSEVEALRSENAALKTRLDKLEGKVEKVEEETSEAGGEKVLEEITARSSKDRNLVLQKCEEAKEDNDPAEADMVGVQGLFDILGVRLEAKHVLVGTRRMGEKRGDDPRPLLLIFKRKADRDLLLERAPRLSKQVDEQWKRIRILADLTLKQRQMEAQLFKKAAESNLKRSEDDASKNLVWKVMGRRGERVLRQYEILDHEEGRVVRKENEGNENPARKRPRSPQTGHSPPLRRQRSTEPGRFGQTTA